MKLTRREFLASTAAAAPMLAAPNLLSAAPAPRSEPRRFQIAAFEKPIQFLDFDPLAEFVADFGFDGIEATVRKNGHVLPEKVEADLPRLVEALKRRGLEILIMTSDINDVRKPEAEKVLRTAARLGIRHYRLAAWRYDLSKPILAQLDAIRPRVAEIAALNRELGMTALYQIHAGATNVGAPVWDLHSLIRNFDPKLVAVAFDIRHATVEGGVCWPINFQLMQPHLGAVYAKDFQWVGRKPQNVPLGEGMVDPKFYQMVARSDFRGPISLHIEYHIERSGDDLRPLKAAFQRDLDRLKSWLKG